MYYLTVYTKKGLYVLIRDRQCLIKSIISFASPLTSHVINSLFVGGIRLTCSIVIVIGVSVFSVIIFRLRNSPTKSEMMLSLYHST